MGIQALLRGRACSCGRKHTCDIRHIVIEAGAISAVRSLTASYEHILLAADRNTYGVCGEAVKEKLGEKCENVLIYESKGFLVPNEEAVEKMQAQLSEKTDLILGVGSGVIQDLCKYVSFMVGLPYMVVATAPSMDGYASVGAAMIAGNMKVTYSAHVPEAIVADVDILKNAPMDMIKAGYGDILGKFSCLCDWKLSQVVRDEYFCDYVYDLTYDMLLRTKDLGPRLLQRDAEAVKTLMEALCGVGIAMAYVGNSRPASGSEHHLSHFFEVIGIMKSEPYFMHGTDVAFSAVYTQRLREKLCAMEAPTKCVPVDSAAWKTAIRNVYADAAEGVIALQEKLGWYEEDMTATYQEKWEEICTVLADAPDSETLIGYLESIELDIRDFEKTYGDEKIKNALRYAKDLKDRYSVLWLYNSLMQA